MSFAARTTREAASLDEEAATRASAADSMPAGGPQSREQRFLHLQSEQGNQYVQRLVQNATANPAIVQRDTGDPPTPTDVSQNQNQTSASKPAHYRFEIKAWIPFPSVPDVEESLHEIGFRLDRSETVSDYTSLFRGDGHAGYEGGFRVFQVAEFDWDGSQISKLTLPGEAHFGESHRDFSATLTDNSSFPSTSRLFKDTDAATTNSAVSSSATGGQEIDLGMSSPNPLTISPAPNIDADYSIFISQDTFGIETVTVRWTTDMMPNHAYRVLRNGTLLKEHIVNSLGGPLSSAEIFIRLNSKSNGGADTFEPGL